MGRPGLRGSTVRHLLAHASGLAFAERVVQAPVASKRIYSSAGGFEVLAELVSRETEIEFADYLAEAVFAPLAMTSAALVGPAGHGAQASADDLAKFAAELLSPTLVSAQTFAEATTVQFPGLNGILPGYGSQRPQRLGARIRNSGRQASALDGSRELGRYLRSFRPVRDVPVGRSHDRYCVRRAYRSRFR